MQLKDIMKQHVRTIAPGVSLRKAAHVLSHSETSLLPVCEGLIIVGLLTMRDITVRATAQGCDPQQATVGDVMFAPPIFGIENQKTEEAADLMNRWRLSWLPVLNSKGQLVGIVSFRDLHRDRPIKRKHREKRVTVPRQTRTNE